MEKSQPKKLFVIDADKLRKLKTKTAIDDGAVHKQLKLNFYLSFTSLNVVVDRNKSWSWQGNGNPLSW